MFRRASLLPALGAVAASAALATTAGPAAAYAVPASVRPASAARAVTDNSPLSVAIDTIAPSYIPRRGPVRVTGSVTNNDLVPWRKVQTYAFISSAPMRTSAELAAAGATDPATDVGARITEHGTYDDLPRIDPGQTVQFSIRVPRADLPASEPGVYWFGVHALGEGPDGRTGGADGRARTFLPLVAPTRRAVDTALVVPLRHGVPRRADGRLTAERAWGRSLAPDGPLGTMVDFGTSAGDRPLTWLVDPALPDAVASLAAGNPPRWMGPSRPDRSGTHESSSPSAGPEAQPSASAGDDATATHATDTTTTKAAAAWLERLKEGLRGSQVLALPYGDMDVAAAAGSAPALFRQARARTGTALPSLGLPVTRAVAPPNGFLDHAGLDLTPHPDTVLVSDRMLPAGSPTLVRSGGRRLVATSSGAASGGPGPDDPLGAVAVRQRILAEAAVRLLSPGPQQLAVLIPQTWAPSSSTGFFEGLDVGWLHLTTVDGLQHGPAPRVPADRLAYPRAEARREVDGANFAAARSLMRTGRTLQDVLLNHTDVAGEIADQALPSTSYAVRPHADRARAATERANAYVQRQLASITITAPRGVTLSSASGRFAATVTNGLEQPVRVSVDAVSDGPLSITSPRRLEIGPDGSSTVLLGAATRRPGIHNVTLRLVDSAGTPLGASDSLPIRSVEVSNVIWVILGTGVVLLFGAIAVRLGRRLRAARAARQA